MSTEIVATQRAMSTVSRLITLILEGLETRGESSDVLFHLQAKEGKVDLEGLIDHLAGIDFRFTKSKLMAEAKAEAINEIEPEDEAGERYVAMHEAFSWEDFLPTRIPVFRFGDAYYLDGYPKTVPQAIIKQLVGRVAHAEMLVEWEGEACVIVGMDYLTVPGEEINEAPSFIALAPARYFDLSA